MEEAIYQERPGLFSRIGQIISGSKEVPEQFEEESSATPSYTLRSAHRYTVTIRKGVTNFDDAVEAAQGLKRGEQQILNLANADSLTRQKIVDFMCGVNFAQEGTWEEIGQDIYLIVPANGYVEVAPCSERVQASRPAIR